MNTVPERLRFPATVIRSLAFETPVGSSERSSASTAPSAMERLDPSCKVPAAFMPAPGVTAPRYPTATGWLTVPAPARRPPVSPMASMPPHVPPQMVTGLDESNPST